MEGFKSYRKIKRKYPLNKNKCWRVMNGFNPTLPKHKEFEILQKQYGEDRVVVDEQGHIYIIFEEAWYDCYLFYNNKWYLAKNYYGYFEIVEPMFHIQNCYYRFFKTKEEAYEYAKSDKTINRKREN